MKKKSCNLICLILVLAMAIVGCVNTDSNLTEPTGSDVTEPTGGEDPVDPVTPTGPVETEPGHEHSYSEVITEATCSEDGYTTYACECGDAYVGGKVSATGHSWGEWVTTKEPTEAATGTAERECSECQTSESKVLDKVIPDHTHSYTGKVTTAATCTKEGVKTYTCSCGGSYTESIPKVSHNYSKKETWPTCYSKGYMTYTCRDCGYSYKGNYKDKVDHSYCWETLEPTCTEDGYTLFMCDYCLGYYYEDITPATGHSFDSYVSNNDATCTADGTKTATCSNGCGNKDTVTDAGSALGHSYSATIVEPTMYAKGYTLHTCDACGDKYKDSYTELSEEARQQFIQDVEAATVKYINQFRQEQGDTVATCLPGLTKVAQYRAVQLQTNFAHSTADLREAYAYYQYGEWIDMTEYGYDASYSHYTANAKEAITKHYWEDFTPDQVGRGLAGMFKNSSGHWAYVGSSDYPYIAVGVSWQDGTWCCCVLQTANNYG